MPAVSLGMSGAGYLALGALLLASACGETRCGDGATAPPEVVSAAAAPPGDRRSRGDGGDLAPPESGAPLASAATESFAARELDPVEEAGVLRALDLSAEEGEIAELIRLSREDPSPAVREAAVITLGDSLEGRAIDALIAASEDTERRVGLAAIAQLAFADDRQARSALERLTASPDPEIAAAARAALEQ